MEPKFLSLEIETYFHSTNLPTFLALQGGWGLEIGIYFHSTNLSTILTLQWVHG